MGGTIVSSTKAITKKELSQSMKALKVIWKSIMREMQAKCDDFYQIHSFLVSINTFQRQFSYNLERLHQMAGLWLNNPNLWRLNTPEQQPVLDPHRNKILTYEKLQRPSNLVGQFDFLRQKGYQVFEEIGRGGYGVVYKAKRYEDGKICAIKVNYDTVARSTVYFEVAFFHLVRKKSNLPKMIDFFFYDNTPHIVLEYFEHQDFIQIFDQLKTLKDVKHYILELLKGVNALKSIGIFHRDIKPMNFLYNMEEKRGIIVDLGLAQIDPVFVEQVIKKRYEECKSKVPKGQQKENEELFCRKEEYNIYKKLLKANLDHGIEKVGTQAYVPLETLIRASGQGHQCQMWSIGVIFLQFLTQKTHFFNEVKIDNDFRQEVQVRYISIFVMEIAHMFGTQPVSKLLKSHGWKVQFPKNMPPKGDLNKMIVLKSQDEEENKMAYDLLLKFLSLNRQQRITAEDAIWHPFFDDTREKHFLTNQKWYLRQLQKRNMKNQKPQVQDLLLNKNFSVFQAQSSFSKSLTKVKGTDKQEDNQSQLEPSCRYRQSRKAQPEQQKANKDSQSQKIEQIKADQIKKITESRIIIVQESERIVINSDIGFRKPQPQKKRTSAKGLGKQKPKEKKMVKKQKGIQKQKQRQTELLKQKQKQSQNQKGKQPAQQELLIDTKLDQILKKEEERIRNEAQKGKIIFKKAEESEESDEYYDDYS